MGMDSILPYGDIFWQRREHRVLLPPGLRRALRRCETHALSNMEPKGVFSIHTFFEDTPTVEGMVYCCQNAGRPNSVPRKAQNSSHAWLPSANSGQEESIFSESGRTSSLFDDDRFTRTKDYTRTIDLLRLLHNALVITIESWENFESGEIRYFEVQEHQALRMIWDSYLAAISKDISDLRFLRRLLQQKIEMFDNKKNGASILAI